MKRRLSSCTSRCPPWLGPYKSHFLSGWIPIPSRALLKGLAGGLLCGRRNVRFEEVRGECTFLHPYWDLGLSFPLGLFLPTAEIMMRFQQQHHNDAALSELPGQPSEIRAQQAHCKLRGCLFTKSTCFHARLIR